LPLAARLDAVWNRLVDEEKAARVFPEPYDGERKDAVAELLSGGDLCAHVDDEEYLERRLQKLYRERETLESSTGDSAFFLALGFLEWYEAPPKEVRPLFAPLLLLHVRLVRKNSPTGGRRVFAMEMDADEHWGNPCLHEKIKGEHNILLPPCDEVSSPEAYLRSVADAVRSKPRWRVHKTAALGFFNFARYRLWLDLAEGQWPDGASPSEHPIVRDLVDQKWRGDSRPLPSDAEIAEHQLERDLPVVLDADSTQYAALVAAIRGQSLVVIGPPGSGKSQTIANLIAVATAAGKRVLFVAQKLAALEVVQRRMGEASLSSFCLPLHSNHSKPLDVHRHLRAAGAEHAHRRSRADGETPAPLARSLNEVATRLASQPAGDAASLAETIQLACVLRARAKDAWGGDWDDELLEIELPERTPSAAWMEERERSLREWGRLRAEAGTHWQGWYPLELFPMDVGKLDTALRAVAEAAGRLQSELEGLPQSLRTATLPRLVSIVVQLDRAKLPGNLVPPLLQHIWAAGRDTKPVYQLERMLDDYHRQRRRATATLREPQGGEEEYARAVLGAATTLGESLDPATPLTAAEAVLADMAAALDQAHDLVATAAVYPAGVRALGRVIERDSSEAVTWGTVDALSQTQPRPEVASHRPPIPSLARHLATGGAAASEALSLAEHLESAREAAGRASGIVPKLLNEPKPQRQRVAESVASVDAAGFGRLPAERLCELKATATEFAARTAEILRLHGLVGGAMRLLLTDVQSSRPPRALAAAAASLDRAGLAPPADIPVTVVEALARGAVTPDELAAWAGSLEAARAAEAQAKRILPRASAGEDVGHRPPPELCGRVKGWCERGGGGTSVSELRRLEKASRDAALAVDHAVKFFGSVARALRQPVPQTVGDLRRLASMAGALRRMPELPASGMLGRLASAADVARVRQAAADGESIVARERALASRVALKDLPPREEIASLRRRLRSHQGRFFRWLSRDYRAARDQVLGFLNRPLPAEADVIVRLDEAEAFSSDSAALAADPVLREVLGPQFRGHHTDWSGVAAVLDWASDFLAQIGDAKLPLDQLATMRQKASAGLDQAPLVVQRVVSHASALSKQGWRLAAAGEGGVPAGGQGEGLGLAALRQMAISAGADVAAAAAELESLGCGADIPLQAVSEALARLTESQQAFQNLEPLREVTRPPLSLVDPNRVRSAARWFESCHGRGVAPAALAWLAAEPSPALESTLHALGEAARWAAAADALGGLAGSAPSPGWLAGGSLTDLLEAARRLTADLEVIVPWLAKDPDGQFLTAELLGVIRHLDRVDAARDAAGPWSAALAGDAFLADPASVRETVTWVQAAMGAGVSGPLLTWCLEAETTPRLRWWLDVAEAARQLRATVERLTRSGVVRPDDFPADGPLVDWQDQAAARAAALAASLDLLTRAAASGGSSVQELATAAAALAHACKLAQELESWRPLVGVDPTSLQSAHVAAHRAWVAAARDLPGDLAAWLVEREPAARYAAATGLRGAIEAVGERSAGLLALMRKFGDLRGLGPAEVTLEDVTVERLRERTRQLQNVAPRLLSWASFLREQAEALDLGLGQLLKAASESAVPPDHLVLAFRAAVAVQQAKTVWQSDRRLRSLRGGEHEQLRRRSNGTGRTSSGKYSASPRVLTGTVGGHPRRRCWPS
jgi:hypothetical protein